MMSSIFNLLMKTLFIIFFILKMQKMSFLEAASCDIIPEGTSKPGHYDDLILRDEETPTGEVAYTLNLIEETNDPINSLELINDTSSLCFEYLALLDTNLTWIKLFDIEEYPDESDYLSNFLTIECHIKCYSSVTTEITIEMEIYDINDNGPIFFNEPFIGFVNESSDKGHVILTISIDDEDLSFYDFLSFYFEPTNLPFEINKRKDTIIDGPYEVNLTVSDSLLLDFETNSSYSFYLYAWDFKGNPGDCLIETIFCNRTLINITVGNINDLGPAFESSSYFLSDVVEETNGTYTVTDPVQLKAVDLDGLYDSKIIYSFNASFPDVSAQSLYQSEYFTIDKDTAELHQIKAFDKETTPKYTLIVWATELDDNGNPIQYQHVSWTTVEIEIQDVNDNPPSMSTNEYTGSVMDISPDGSIVAVVSASDIDEVENSTLEFNFVEDSFIFQISSLDSDYTVGIITVKNSSELQKLSDSELNLQVYAFDGKFNSTASNVTINIRRNEGPYFSQDIYFTEVFENETNKEILQVNAADIEGDTIEYSLFNGANNTSNLFQIESSSGIITLNGQLDAEEIGSYVLTVKAFDNPSRFSVAMVYIQVLNINDELPYFEKSNYSEEISEASLVGTTVVVLQAKDADVSDVELNYTIEEEDSPFFIQNIDNMGIVVTNASLYSETNFQYVLTLKVNDGFNENTTSLTIDVVDTNNNNPEFDEFYGYNFTSHENISLSTIIGNVSVTDFDKNENSEVKNYQLLGPSSSVFLISPEGTINAKSPLSNQAGTYQLLVMAEDGGTYPRTGFAPLTITIEDINSYPPQFENGPYEASILENQEPPKPIIQVTVTDGDTTANVTYSLVNSTTLLPFTINPTTGMIYWTSNELPDRELQSTWEFEVEAFDGDYSAMSNVTIVVEDENDEPPKFTDGDKYLRVGDVTLPGTLLVTVAAVDDDIGCNNDVYFELLSSEDANKFFIETHSNSSVTLYNLETLETANFEFNVEILAYNKPLELGLNDTVAIQIQVSSVLTFTNTPYEETIAQNVSVGTQIINITAESLSGGSNGILYNITAQNFTRNLESTLINQTLDYEIADPTNGLITVKNNLMLGLYQLTVEAVNQSNSLQFAYENVLIKVVDCCFNSPPNFADSLLSTSISSDSIPGDFVIKVEATDPDYPAYGNGEVTYSLVSDYFMIDTSSGNITVSASLLDLGQELIVVNVTATDKALTPASDVAAVWININTSSSLCNPQLDTHLDKANFTEENDLVTDIYRFTITCAGVQTWANLNLALENTYQDRFYVEQDGKTGIVKTNYVFNFEKDSSLYELVVVITEGGSSISPEAVFMVLLVELVDVNDNPPEFTKESYSFDIDECNCTDQMVGQVFALDVDTDDNALIEYSIQSSTNYSSLFHINESTGMLYTREPIDREVLPDLVDITVMAENSKLPFNSSNRYLATSQVQVRVLDINDNSPQFDQVNYYVPWEAAIIEPETYIFTVQAGDIDINEENSEVFYIIEMDPDNKYDYTNFVVGKESGDIYNVKELLIPSDACYQEYMFYVVAYDNGLPRMESSVPFTLRQIDSSCDNPVFEKRELNLTDQGVFVPPPSHMPTESQKPGDWYLDLPDALNDDPSSQVVVYALSGTNEDFNLVNCTTPTLTNSVELDREEKEFYDITVTANYVPTNCSNPCSCPTELDVSSFSRIKRDTDCTGSVNQLCVLLEVQDINDAAPQFDEISQTGPGFYLRAIADNVPYGYTIMQIMATDNDSQDNTALTYFIEEGTGSDKFSMESQTGILRTADSFANSVGEIYNLNVSTSDGVYTSYATVTIQVLNVYQHTVMESNLNNEEIISSKETIEQELNTLIGGDYFVHIEHVGPHVEKYKLDSKLSDVWFYVMNISSATPLTFTAVKNLLSKDEDKYNAFVQKWEVTNFVNINGKYAKENVPISNSEAALMTFAVLIVLITIIVILGVLMLWESHQKQQILQNKLEEMVPPLTVENPMYISRLGPDGNLRPFFNTLPGAIEDADGSNLYSTLNAGSIPDGDSLSVASSASIPDPDPPQRDEESPVKSGNGVGGVGLPAGIPDRDYDYIEPPVIPHPDYRQEEEGMLDETEMTDGAENRHLQPEMKMSAVYESQEVAVDVLPEEAQDMDIHSDVIREQLERIEPSTAPQPGLTSFGEDDIMVTPF